MRLFERYLTVGIVLCILAGIALGKFAREVATTLDGMTVTLRGAPVISVPIAICLFFMMYPILLKIDCSKVYQASRNIKSVALTLILNWAIMPFPMYALAFPFPGKNFAGFFGPEAVDLVKLPFSVVLPAGAAYGAGTVVLQNGVKFLEVPLGRS